MGLGLVVRAGVRGQGQGYQHLTSAPVAGLTRPMCGKAVTLYWRTYLAPWLGLGLGLGLRASEGQG